MCSLRYLTSVERSSLFKLRTVPAPFPYPPDLYLGKLRMATTPTEIFEKDIDVVDFDDDKRKRDVESPEVISVVVPELPDATIREAAG